MMLKNAKVRADFEILSEQKLDEFDRKPLSKLRLGCAAKTRKGSACRNRVNPGKTRCRMHGGLSTGPKTKAGKLRISKAMKERWAAYRQHRDKSLD